MHSIYSSPISHHTITHFVQVEPVFHVLFFFILILKVFHRLVIFPHSKICNSLLKEFYSSELINNYFSLCLHQKKNQLCDPSNNASYNVSECLFFRVVTLLVVFLTHSFSTQVVDEFYSELTRKSTRRCSKKSKRQDILVV